MKNSPCKDSKCVFLSDGILIALVTPLGFRSEWGALLGYLKIEEGKALKIERSELAFLDADRNILESRCDAFGLGDETKLAGPYSERFSDDSRRPAGAVAVRWRVNEMDAKASLLDSESNALRVIYLPFHVAVKGDPHIVITVVNRTEEMLNIVEGVRNAVCIVDGKRFPSNIGGHWDGGSYIQPKKSITKKFSLGAARF